MKNKELIVYPAIFTKHNDNGEYYVVEFIDFNAITDGKNLEEAFYMAQDAMGLYLDELTNRPVPTIDFSNIKLNKNQFISYVSIDMDEYRKKFNSKSVKKTLTIPMWLNTMAEKENINFSQLLQESLKQRLGID